jgi:Na+-translocating ferredoxin:NAD+ oxidoreductase RnfD subunit
MTARAFTFAGASYPVHLPNIRDPRLHVASVIITIHVLGQLALDFRVSVPQILAAILTCWILEVAITFRQSRAFVWPASAMLTGSGVALIMRAVGTPDDPWTTYAWELFAIVAGLSLLTKYVIKHRGTHVFNPSNIGLVVAFVALGSPRVEPLDFWWVPLDAWLLLAYAVILVGGLLITRRLKLLALAATFWVTFAIGLGLLAGAGQCMTANWSFSPVCGLDYWRVIATSPEVLIFLFFMITDPKTVPTGNVGRVAFGFLVGVTSVLLMAPQTDEFGAKVGLLAGLVVICAARPLIDRLVPHAGSDADQIGRFVASWTRGFGAGAGLARTGVRVGGALAAVVVLGLSIVAAGTPARGRIVPDINEVLDDVPHHVDPATLPAITMDADVTGYDVSLVGPGAAQLVVTLGENLLLESEALLRQDEGILTAVDHGDRLAEMRARLRESVASGKTTVASYDFDSVEFTIVRPFGVQSGLSLGLDARGTVTHETYDVSRTVIARETSPFASMFVLRRATGDRWLNVAVLPAGSSP